MTIFGQRTEFSLRTHDEPTVVMNGIRRQGDSVFPKLRSVVTVEAREREDNQLSILLAGGGKPCDML